MRKLMRGGIGKYESVDPTAPTGPIEAYLRDARNTELRDSRMLNSQGRYNKNIRRLEFIDRMMSYIS